MEKQCRLYNGIDPRKALATTLTILGLFIAYDLQKNIKQNELIEIYSGYLNACEGEKIDPNRNPVLKDVNRDGLEDLIFQLKSGEDLILYKNDKGYSFNKP